MKLKVTVEVLAEETGSAIALGTISGDLDITEGGGFHSTDPVLTVKMRNVLDAVRETIFEDSQPEPERKCCICAPNQEAVRCPKHGEQSANREMCPQCGKHVLGYCAQGEYCTGDDCGYVA